MTNPDPLLAPPPERDLGGRGSPIWSMDLVLVLLAFLALCFWFQRHRLGEYTLADTLLNYQQGFYRRALLGNLFLFLPGTVSVFAAMKVLYAGSLAAVFALASRLVQPSLARPIRLWLLGAILILPFGISFYLKDLLGVRKELVFFPLLVLFSLSRRSGRIGTNLAALVVTLVGCLVHESYTFLVLPFLVSILWLDEKLSCRWLCVHLLFAIAVNAIILGLSVGPAGPVGGAIRACVKLGMRPSELENFAGYNSLTLTDNIAKSFSHLANPNLLVYTGLFLLQWLLLARLPRSLGYKVSLADPRKLRVCLLGMGLGTLLIICIGTDFGRWLTFSCILGVVIISHQVREVAFRTEIRRPAEAAGWLAIACCLILFVHVPHWTNRSVEVADWLTGVWNARLQP